LGSLPGCGKVPFSFSMIWVKFVAFCFWPHHHFKSKCIVMPIRMVSDPAIPSKEYQLIKVRIVHFYDSRIKSRPPKSGVFPLMLDQELFVKQLINKKLVDSFERYDIAKSIPGYALALQTISGGNICRVTEGRPYLVFAEAQTYDFSNPFEPYEIRPNDYIDSSGIICIQFVFKPKITTSNFLGFRHRVITTYGFRINRKYPFDMRIWISATLNNIGLIIGKNIQYSVEEPNWVDRYGFYYQSLNRGMTNSEAESCSKISRYG